MVFRVNTVAVLIGFPSSENEPESFRDGKLFSFHWPNTSSPAAVATVRVYSGVVHSKRVRTRGRYNYISLWETKGETLTTVCGKQDLNSSRRAMRRNIDSRGTLLKSNHP
jgi:hypothetical protein